jgi:type II secretory pathway pseudopilin PulG
MKHMKNEKGMALITVILIFTVFSLLGLVIFSSITSNMKQISKTEENVQATDLAEMGVMYYRTVTENSIRKVFATPTNGGDMVTRIVLLKEEIKKSGEKKQISGTDVFFELKNLTAEFNSGSLVINLNSIGTVDIKESRRLNLKLTYTFNNDGAGNYTVIIPTVGLSPNSLCGTELTDNTNLKNDKDSNILTCSYTITPESNLDKLNNIENAAIYLSGDLDMSNQINQVTNGQIYIKGTFDTQGLVNFYENSIVMVEKKATIGQINNTYGNFTLLVGGDLEVYKINNIVNSTIYVNDFAIFPKDQKNHISINTNSSKLCVGKGVKYVTIDNKGVKQYSEPIPLKDVSIPGVYINGDPNYGTKCSKYSLVSFDPIETVEYK